MDNDYLIAALWMGLAHSVGWAARGVGRQAATAKEIDPEHRRDGAGLLMLGLAILVGVAVWAGSAGPVGARLADAMRLFFGALAVFLPLLFLFVSSFPHPAAWMQRSPRLGGLAFLPSLLLALLLSGFLVGAVPFDVLFLAMQAFNGLLFAVTVAAVSSIRVWRRRRRS